MPPGCPCTHRPGSPPGLIGPARCLASGTPYGHFACIRAPFPASRCRVSRNTHPMNADEGRQAGHQTRPPSRASERVGRHSCAPALDETRSSAPMPNSPVSAEGHVCPHTTYGANLRARPRHARVRAALRRDVRRREDAGSRSRPQEGRPRSSIAPPLEGGPTSVDTRIVISTSDIEADHTALKARRGRRRRGDRALGHPPMLG